jgi:hypothetical protein
MTVLYRRPAGRMPLSVGPQLASWDRGGSPSQVRLGQFLDHAEAVATPAMAMEDGPFAVELTVGLSVTCHSPGAEGTWTTTSSRLLSG